MGLMDFNIKDAGSAISGLFTGIREAITGEKIKDPQAMADLQYKLAELETRWENYKTKVLEFQQNIIIAEAKGDGWLQKNWRPLTMLSFVIIIIAYWFGYQPQNMSDAIILEVFGIIKIGLGGYVVGRSVEKTAKTVAEVVTKYKEK